MNEALVERAWAVLGGVPDPEIPVISVVDLGIVRGVAATGEGVEVSLTPTYAGCPATRVIERDIAEALATAGISVRLVTRLSPPWTTDWISERGRAQLRDSGIAPPGGATRPVTFHAAKKGSDPISLGRGGDVVACPRCGAVDTEVLSQFGSTACKALYRCRACREPFDYFKPL